MLALRRVVIGVSSALSDSFAHIRDLRVCLVCQFEHVAGVVLIHRGFHLSVIAFFLAETSNALQVHNLVLPVHVLVIDCFGQHFNFVTVFKKFVCSLEVLYWNL